MKSEMRRWFGSGSKLSLTAGEPWDDPSAGVTTGCQLCPGTGGSAHGVTGIAGDAVTVTAAWLGGATC
eukprot:4662638-Lingulodinium_polyedra.AAC.1